MLHKLKKPHNHVPVISYHQETTAETREIELNKEDKIN